MQYSARQFQPQMFDRRIDMGRTDMSSDCIKCGELFFKRRNFCG